MPVPKTRITPDSELASEGAILFRIDQIKRENNPLTEAAARRIKALELRLPTQSGGPIKPAVPAHLLISKKDME